MHCQTLFTELSALTHVMRPESCCLVVVVEDLLVPMCSIYHSVRSVEICSLASVYRSTVILLTLLFVLAKDQTRKER
jgi:hypothetical protein